MPLSDEPAINVFLAVFQVGALQRIFYDVEEERVVQDFEKLVITIAGCPLRIRLVAPEQLARNRCSILSQRRKEIHAIDGIRWIGFQAGSSEQCGHPVHADSDLLGCPALWDARRPRDQSRNAQTAFQQFCLLACERPGIGEALPAIVAVKMMMVLSVKPFASNA
jgi:hypothetical protein